MAQHLNAPTQLRCEYVTNPLGIDVLQPRLSWEVSDARRGATQSAYQVIAASSPDLLAQHKGDLWNSRKVASAQSAQVVYQGKALTSRQRCYWKVRTWDADGKPSPWSHEQVWEMGLLAHDDWSAEWIGMPVTTSETYPPATYLSKSFALKRKRVRKARIYATALGVYELHLNGQRVGDAYFAPGWTDYRQRVMVQSYDVTAQVHAGQNTLLAVLGDGWYAGALGWKLERNNFGEPPARLLLQLEIEYTDGSTQRMISDGSWHATTDGPIRMSDFYAGEVIDARLSSPLIPLPPGEEKKAHTFPDEGQIRSAQMDPPIRITEEITPVSVHEHEPGVFIFDFGQNMVGFCRLRAQGRAGTAITLRHAEELRADGSMMTENLRNAKVTDTFILAGSVGPEIFQPHFTYHGFRFVEVRGYPGTPGIDALTGLVLHTDAPFASTFASSDDMLNALYRNVLWGQRGNMHSVVTDCPQRDERLGWLADAHVFARSASFNMDMAAMLAKYVRDIRETQTPDGCFADIAPFPFQQVGGVLPPAGAPGWADAGVIVPWMMYQTYGDTRILAENFDAMGRFVDYVLAKNPNGLWQHARGNDYGDWVPADSVTDKIMYSTLYFFHSANLLSRIAGVLGYPVEQKKYGQVARLVQTAFNARYLRPNSGTYKNATQTINAMALDVGIVPKAQREAVARDLVRDIKRRGWHLSTGIHGTRYLLSALSEAGYDDVAYRVLLARDYPSWGYMIEKGATTIWERWNTDKMGPEMNSRNHFAFGSVVEWLFRYLAGIELQPGTTGYQHLLIHPRIVRGGGLSHVKATYHSIHGLIGCEWRITDALEVNVRVPANTSAQIVLPAASPKQITEGGQPLRDLDGLTRIVRRAGRTVVEAGAGSYAFVMRG